MYNIKSFESFLNELTEPTLYESWRKHRDKYKKAIFDTPDRYSPGHPDDARDNVMKRNKRDVRIGRSRGNKFTRRHQRGLLDDFKAAIGRGETPGPGWDQTIPGEEQSRRRAVDTPQNNDRRLDQADIKYRIGKKTSDIARERDRIRFQSIKDKIMSYHFGKDSIGDPNASSTHNRLVKFY